MERKGGCCLAPRYGGAAAAHQAAGAAWQMGSIMLKFRPIAPKPAAVAPGPTPAPVVAVGRGKRKAVGGRGGRRGRKPKKAVTVAAVAAAPPAPRQAVGNCKDDDKDSDNNKLLPSRSSSSSGMTSVDTSPPPPPPQLATLALLPVPPRAEDEAAVDTVRAEEPASLVVALAAGAPSTDPRAMPPAAAAAASCWVTVEEVTGTWPDGEAPSSAACVGSGAAAFVSDQWGRVAWRNAAFGRLVSTDDGDEEALVALAGTLPAWGTCAGFTCRVRIRHSIPHRVGSSVVAPCDVCRLDAAGCYLWRLDLQAALTLGRLP